MKFYLYDELTTIASFTYEYRFLSNFYPCEIKYNFITFPSVEHAYQAQKTMDSEMIEKIRSCETPGKAKKLGQSIEIRPGWEIIKYSTMKLLLIQKFCCNETLKQNLLSTSPKILIEGNKWGDQYWGCTLENNRWVGQNHLGCLLMEIRDEFIPGFNNPCSR